MSRLRIYLKTEQKGFVSVLNICWENEKKRNQKMTLRFWINYGAINLNNEFNLNMLCLRYLLDIQEISSR